MVEDRDLEPEYHRLLGLRYLRAGESVAVIAVRATDALLARGGRVPLGLAYSAADAAVGLAYVATAGRRTEDTLLITRAGSVRAAGPCPREFVVEATLPFDGPGLMERLARERHFEFEASVALTESGAPGRPLVDFKLRYYARWALTLALRQGL